MERGILNKDDGAWQTKPTDRFVLKWIKNHLSARITPKLVSHGWLRPWMITLFSSALGVLAGVVFALGFGWIAGTIAAFAQIMDGVDGQFARLTRRQSAGGAFWDSVLDRYADGAMMIGLVIYLTQIPLFIPLWLLLVLGSFAFIGSNLISYSKQRAGNLGIDLGRPNLASKGTRATVMILCGWGSLFWPSLPVVALFYLMVHPNCVVIAYLIRALKTPQTL
jgi:phosphatidylglycerophosphate synthase